MNVVTDFEAAQKGRGHDGFRLVLRCRPRFSRRSTSSSQASNSTHASMGSNAMYMENAAEILRRIGGLRILFDDENG